MAEVKHSHNITWTCQVCREPINAGAGYLYIDYADIAAMDRQERDWKEYRSTLGDHPVISLAEYAERNPILHAPWRVHHDRCDPDPDSHAYWIAVGRAQTHADLLTWTAHLMGKNWLHHTNWADLIRRAAGGAA